LKDVDFFLIKNNRIIEDNIALHKKYPL